MNNGVSSYIIILSNKKNFCDKFREAVTGLPEFQFYAFHKQKQLTSFLGSHKKNISIITLDSEYYCKSVKEQITRLQVVIPDLLIVLLSKERIETVTSTLGIKRIQFNQSDEISDIVSKIETISEYQKIFRKMALSERFIKETESLLNHESVPELFLAACKAAYNIFEIDHSGLVYFNPGGKDGVAKTDYPSKLSKNVTIKLEGIKAADNLIKSKMPIFINDISNAQDLGDNKQTLVMQGVAAVAFIPIIKNNKVIASLGLDQYSKGRNFSKYEEELMAKFGKIVSDAYLNCLKFDTKLIADFTKIGNTSRYWSKEMIFEYIYKLCLKLIKVKNFYLAFVNETSKKLEFPFVVHDTHRIRDYDNFPEYKSRDIQHHLTEYIIRTNKPFFKNSNLEAEVTSIGCERIGKKAKSFLGVPIQLGRTVIGVIAIQDFEFENEFMQYDLDALSQIAVILVDILHKNALEMEILKKMTEVSQKMSISENIEQIADLILKGFNILTSCDRASFQLVTQDFNRELIARVGYDEKDIDNELLKNIKDDKVIDTLLTNGNIFISPDVREIDGWEDKKSTKDIKAWIFIPIKFQDRALAVVTLDKYERYGFNPEIIGQIETYTKNVTLILEKALVDRGQKLLSAIYDLMKLNLQDNEMLHKIVTTVTNGMRCSHCAIFFPETIQGTIQLRSRIFIGPKTISERVFRSGEGIAGISFAKQIPILYNAAQNAEGYVQPKEKTSNNHAILCVPIICEGKSIGVISADNNHGSVFTDHDREFLEKTADFVSLYLNRYSAIGPIIDCENKIITSEDDETIVSEILRIALKLLGTQAGVCYFMNRQTREIIRSYPKQNDIKLNSTYPDNVCPNQLAFEQFDISMMAYVDVSYKTQYKNALCIAGNLDEGYMIAIELYFKMQPEGFIRHFSETDKDILSLIFNQLLLALSSSMRFKTREALAPLTRLGMVAGSLTHQLKGNIFALANAVNYVDANQKMIISENGLEKWQTISSQTKTLQTTFAHISDLFLGKTKTDGSSSLSGILSKVQDKLRVDKLGEGLTLDDSFNGIIVKVDEITVVESLFNIIKNALKCSASPKVMVSCNVLPANVEILIEDNGPGIPEDIKATFHTLIQKSDTGMGIGLYSSYQWLQINHGNLEIIKNNTTGSIIRVTLPKYCCDVLE